MEESKGEDTFFMMKKGWQKNLFFLGFTVFSGIIVCWVGYLLFFSWMKRKVTKEKSPAGKPATTGFLIFQLIGIPEGDLSITQRPSEANPWRRWIIPSSFSPGTKIVYLSICIITSFSNPG
ncbi:MAG: hypothetical protein LUD15_04330 [Bacteroides sp.]|nr:hypothetical protein [Bacteroides sp.]